MYRFKILYNFFSVCVCVGGYACVGLKYMFVPVRNIQCAGLDVKHICVNTYLRTGKNVPGKDFIG